MDGRGDKGENDAATAAKAKARRARAPSHSGGRSGFVRDRAEAGNGSDGRVGLCLAVDADGRSPIGRGAAFDGTAGAVRP